MTPKPTMISGGKDDPLVKFEWQELEVAALTKVNGCETEGKPWENGKGTLYPSKGGTPLVTYFYEGGHGMSPEEPGLIVQFFQHVPIQ